MNKRTEKIAKEFNIVDKVQKLENELMQVKGCVKVDFDLFGFFDNMNQVIFVAHYDIEADKDYFVKRKEFINNILKVANNNGLTRTEDQIEDYGTSFYFVTRYNKEWIQE